MTVVMVNSAVCRLVTFLRVNYYDDVLVVVVCLGCAKQFCDVYMVYLMICCTVDFFSPCVINIGDYQRMAKILRQCSMNACFMFVLR